jgi:hypothetical protein
MMERKEAIQCTEEGKEAALILYQQTLPCIMHIENRESVCVCARVRMLWGRGDYNFLLLSIGATGFQSD